MLNKTVLRWMGIIATVIFYIIAVMIPVFGYGLTMKYNSPPSTGTMNVDTCDGIIDILSQSFDQLLMTSLIGNIACVVITLYIFKKIR
ncbi:hypothetical protein SAMN05192562_101672 [Kosakonia arachidis]|uniref:Uncharacterized protein n=1 Tax=Kosakonia arachidis TaxID=551989 RepID=A0A1I6YQ61_9ENTR|nr:hypothetical protein [Kosakonia arachidis]SFT52545.1 hypothetical protein SAMN05192562_101672 [Kosakonia arachidis]